ncbi:MAG: TrkH family potassium uptake protein [Spirochaetaceae bacterium]|jgi:trk system potassium uptake protein TrkH|nr:TrkH family potassium uptake protein [Spirochaetaceae bacterium]
MKKNARKTKKAAAAFFSLARPVVFLLDIAAALMLIPLGYAAFLGDGVMVRAFAVPAACELLAALPFHFFTRQKRVEFGPADGFILVFAAWTLSIFLGAFPWFLSGEGIGFTDAFFESSCGFATTGATTVADVEALPRPLLLWRSLIHWAGGMGIVLLTVALLPLFGIGAFQMVKAETPGPEKEKVTPKITAAAKILWLVYTALTALLILLYRLGGMDWFDAVCNALPVMASGGVSTKNAGLAFFNSPFIDIVSTVFMLAAGINFNVYFRLLRGKFREVLANTECRVYLAVFAAASLIIAWSLIPGYGSIGAALRYASAQTASVLSTTGSAAADYERWPPLAQAVLFALMFIGGCSGSTAGGIKIIRHVILWKQAGNEIRRIMYPRGIFGVRINNKTGDKHVVYGVAGFIAAYGLVVLATSLATAASGCDILSSVGTALAVTGNVGIGFGASGPAAHYGAFPAALKWFYSFVMVAGRLEIWTALVILTPGFRRHRRGRR